MTVEIPAPGDGFVIVAPNQGPELLEFLASTSGQSWLFTKKPEGADNFIQLGSTTKAIAKEIVEALPGKKEGKAMAASQSLVIAVD